MDRRCPGAGGERGARGDDRALVGGTAGPRRRTGRIPRYEYEYEYEYGHRHEYGRGCGPGVHASPRTSPHASVLAASRIAFAGLQAGVCAGSLARAVHHTTTREQFGRPLSTNQGVLLRAADAHMDTEAIRVTAYEAAWRYDRRLDHQAQALTAAWWASEAGRRVVHTGQHLHGGTGADLDHPVHRHFLWGRQLSAYPGCGGEVLEELGLLLAEGGRQEGSS